jgi:hypothetical protein
VTLFPATGVGRAPLALRRFGPHVGQRGGEGCRVLFGTDEGGDDAHGQDTDDHRQRDNGRDRHLVREDHLDADEGQQEHQAHLQVAKLGHQCSQGEVEATQAQELENIRGKDEKRVACDGEDRRHRVDGKQHVGALDEQQHQE